MKTILKQKKKDKEYYYFFKKNMERKFTCFKKIILLCIKIALFPLELGFL